MNKKYLMTVDVLMTGVFFFSFLILIAGSRYECFSWSPEGSCNMLYYIIHGVLGVTGLVGSLYVKKRIHGVVDD